MNKKRRALDGSTNAAVETTGNSPSRFLPFHLRMLKSMYDTLDEEGKIYNTNPEGSSAKQDDKRGTISAPGDAIWKGIETFLKQRNKLLQAQKESLKAEGAHSAALSHLCKKSSSSSTGLSPSRTGESSTSSPDPIFRRRTHEQATHSPSILQSPLNKSLHTTFASLAGSSQTTGQRHAFRLVSVLLHKRAVSVQRQYHATAAPFVELHTFVQNQITALEDQVDDLQQALGRSTRSWRKQLVESPRSPPSATHAEQSEERRSALAAVQAKLQLWKFLHQDLQETMQNKK